MLLQHLNLTLGKIFAILLRRPVRLLVVLSLLLNAPTPGHAAGNRMLLDLPMGYTLDRGLVELWGDARFANKTVDVFNVVEQTEDTFSAFRFGVNAGLFERLTLGGWLEEQQYDISPRLPDGAQVDRRRLGLRFNLRPETEELPAFTLGFDYLRNRTSDLTVILLPQTRARIRQAFGDETYQLSWLSSRRWSSWFAVHPLLSWASTTVLGESQHTWTVGTNLEFQVTENLVLAGGIRRLFITRHGGMELNIFGPNVRFRRINVPETDSNTVLEARVVYFLHPNVSLQLFGAFFANGLAGEVPHLNILAEQFSPGTLARFGYVGVGINYRFSFPGWK
ncbi:MAG: hypothetical protein HYY96_09250 [Candidatus Tectomicrobia bacterium]|nr:hypothetical protein [Candidatus Tectomicrobia bacterium]